MFSKKPAIPLYQDYRRDMLQIAAGLNLNCHSFELGKDPDNNPIYSDILYTSIDSSKPTYVFNVGCHGVEGYLGSGIMQIFLRDMPSEKLNKINLVLVHPLSPFGMAWYRRCNANYVDLNRNFIVTPERPVNRKFEALRDFLSSKNKIDFAKNALMISMNEGFIGNRRILGMGQYDFPDMPFYGGREVQEEILQVFGFLQNLLANISCFVVFDIHSGMGERGTENLYGLTKKSEHYEMLKHKCPEKKFGDLEEESWEPSGSLEHAVRHYFDKTYYSFIVLEFGTRPSLDVLYALIHDHVHFENKKTDPARINMMLDAFFLPEDLLKIAAKQAAITFNTVMDL